MTHADQATFHLAYGQNLVTHPFLGYLAPHIRDMAARAQSAQPGVEYRSGSREILYVESGIGRIAVGETVVDVFRGAVLQIDGDAVPFQVLPPLQDIDVRRVTMRR